MLRWDFTVAHCASLWLHCGALRFAVAALGALCFAGTSLWRTALSALCSDAVAALILPLYASTGILLMRCEAVNAWMGGSVLAHFLQTIS